MKVSWHGNRKHISARWHTKGLPVLHVAFLREGIQRGFKCYHDLTNKISQLWLTRLLNFHFFMKPCLSCFSLFLHRRINLEHRINILVTHLWVYFSSHFLCWSVPINTRANPRFPPPKKKTPIKLIPATFHTFFRPLAVPHIWRYHFSSSRWRR